VSHEFKLIEFILTIGLSVALTELCQLPLTVRLAAVLEIYILQPERQPIEKLGSRYVQKLIHASQLELWMTVVQLMRFIPQASIAANRM